jgi:hypothetical protein
VVGKGKGNVMSCAARWGGATAIRSTKREREDAKGKRGRERRNRRE